MSPTEEFAFLLALELGVEDPYAMLARMPATTFGAWRQFWRKFPFGPGSRWLQSSQIQATIANSAPFRGKDAKALSPGDFMPPDPDAKRVRMPSEHDRIMIGARAMGATVIGGRIRNG